MRKSGQHLDDAVMSRYLRDALEKLELKREGLGWYQATRHTFASQFVLAGGSLETLRRIMGHSTVLVTERYAHLQPDHFAEADLSRMEGSAQQPFKINAFWAHSSAGRAADF